MKRKICKTEGCNNFTGSNGKTSKGSPRFATYCTACKIATRKRMPKFHLIKKNYCELCGFIPVISRQLDIHHIDGIHTNNEMSNLKTLCANCHRLVHANS